MITEDYVSFETAKLLKEKGFDGECRDYYNTDGHFYSEDFSSNWNDPRNRVLQYASAPTLQMAMKWLRDVHSIFIGISVCERYENETDIEPIVMFFFELLNLKDRRIIDGYSQEYVHTYEEACESAIKYCLENLI